MAKKHNIEDYTKYFLPVNDGVMVDTAIFKQRKTLGGKIWDILRLMSGAGDENNVSEFESVLDDAYLMRREFGAIRQRLYEIVAKRDGEFCQTCKTTIDLTIDHIFPISRGGTNDVSNLRILCRKHNSQKGAR